MVADFINTVYGPISGDFAQSLLGDLCVSDDGVQTGPFGSQLHASDYVNHGTPIITVEHLGDNRIIHADLPLVSDEDKERLSKYTLKTSDIVFSRVGSVDRRAIVYPDEDGWLFSGRCLRVRPDQRKIDPGYLSWFLGLPGFKEHIRQIAVGATMPSLNTTILNRVVIYYPALLKDQQAIAHILGTLDDKIELNRRMNETLEAMTRAIFKSWFVDFDPVRAKAEGGHPDGLDADTAALFPDSFEDSLLGEIPKGWRVGKASELISLNRATLNPGDYPDEVFNHYSIPAFDETQTPKVEKGEEIKSNKFIVPPESVLLSKLNPRLFRIWLPTVSTGYRSICSTEFLVVLARNWVTREFLYLLFSSQVFIDEFVTLVTGTSGSHQRVKPEYLLNLDLILPMTNLIKQFTQLVRPLLQTVVQNRRQSLTLAATRDALLPRLLSGEVRVKEADLVGRSEQRPYEGIGD